MMNDRTRRALIGLCVAAVLLGSTVAPVAPAAAQTSGQVYGQPSLDVFASTTKFDAGTESELHLTIRNRGRIDQGGPARYEERITTARGLTVEVKSGNAPIEVNTGSLGVDNVPTGTSEVAPVDITVTEDAEPGTYRVPVELSYAYTRLVDYDSFGAEYVDNTRSVTEYVTIRVRDQAQFEVVGTSTTAQVDNTGDLSVTIENVGTQSASDASVTAASRSDEFTFGTSSGSSTADVGRWDPGERRTVEYTVGLTEDATRRNYTVDLDVGYTDTNGITQTSKTLSIGVQPDAEQRFALANVSTALRVGEEGTISGTVRNEGPRAVTNPVVVLSTNNPNVDIDSAEYALPDLDPGERATFEYTVSVSDASSPSVQQFDLTTRYRNDRGDLRTDDTLETTARIEPQRDRFVVEATTDRIEAGSSRAVTVRITNNGDEPLTNVEAKAFLNDPLSSDNDEAIVTALAPGETEEFTIAVSAAAGALPKTYPLSFDFQYEMPDGDTEVSKTYTSAVTVTESAGGGFPLPVPLPVVIGALVIVGVVGAVGWRRWSG